MGRRRDGDPADRGHDDAAAGEPGRDPLRPGQRARRHRHPGRQRRPTARHGRGRVGRPGVGPPGRDRPGWSRPPTGGSRCSTRGRTRATATWSCGPTRPRRSASNGGRRTATSRTEYDTALSSTSGGPRHPGVLVSGDGSTALLSSRDGPLLLLDLATDTVAGPGPFTQPPSCEPLARWSPTEAVVGCGSSVQVNTYDDLVGRPLLVTPVGATPTRAAVVWATTGSPVVQMDNLCSGSLATLSTDGHITPITLPKTATGLVPNVAVGGTLYLGGTRCASDGADSSPTTSPPAGSPSWPDRAPAAGRSVRPSFSPRPRRPGSPRSIGAKRGVLATHRGEAEIVVGRTSWGG